MTLNVIWQARAMTLILSASSSYSASDHVGWHPSIRDCMGLISPSSGMSNARVSYEMA